MPVTRLDAAASGETNALAYSVSAGTNRALLVGVTQEGSGLGQLVVGYGGQTMQHVAGIAVGDSTDQRVDLYFLNDAGIAAAGDNQIDLTTPPTSFSINAASYEDCVQTTPTVTDTDALTGAGARTLNFTTEDGGVAVCVGGMGNSGTVVWSGGVTEQTEQVIGTTALGSLADELIGTGAAEAYVATWTTANRSAAAGCLVEFLSAEGITGVVPTTFDFDAPDVDIDGTNFGASQGSGTVYLSDAATLAGSANEVEIANGINAWGDTQINLDLTGLNATERANLNTLGPGQRYLIVVTNASDEYGSAALTVHRAHAFEMSASANITDTGEATTAQLTAPATKTTGDFGGGRITDLENPDNTTVDLAADEYREDEWCIQGKPLAEEAQYQFRVLLGGAELDDYSADPRWTITGGQPVTAAHISSTATLGAPTVAPQAVGITGAHIASTVVLFAATILAGALPVTGAHIASTASLAAPSVAVGAAPVTAAHIASTATLAPPTVAPQAVGVTVAHIASGAIVGGPDVAYVVETAHIGGAGPAISFVGYSSTGTLPSGGQIGDVIFAQIWDSSSGIGPFTGWTQLGSEQDMGGGYFLAWFYRVWQSGDSMPSWPAVFNETWAYRNPSGANPVFDSSVSSGSGATRTLGSIHAQSDGDAAFYMGGGNTSGAWSTPTNYVERSDSGSDTAGGDRLGLNASQSTSGSITGPSSTWSTIHILIAVPVTGGGATLFAPSVSYGIGVPHIASTAALYPPSVVGAGDQPVTGAHIASGASLAPPAVAPGPVAVTGGTIASTSSLATPSVAPGPVAVAGAHIASTAALYPPTVVGAGAVAGAHIASTTTLHPPTVAPGPVAVTGGTIASTSSLAAPSVAPGAVAVAGAHIASGVSLAAPTIAVGAVGVTSAHIASTAALYPPTVAEEGVVVGAHIASSATLSPPTVAPGPVAVTGGTIASTSSLAAPSVAPGAVAVAGAHIASVAALYPPTVGQEGAVAGAHIASSATLHPPTVAAGPVAVTSAHIASTATLYAPTIQLGQEVTGAHIASGASLAPPTVAPGPVAVTGGTIASTSSLAAPSVAPGAVAVAGAHIASTATLAAPSVAYQLVGAHIPSSSSLGPPAIAVQAVAVTGAHIASSATLYAPTVVGGTLYSAAAEPGDQPFYTTEIGTTKSTSVIAGHLYTTEIDPT